MRLSGWKIFHWSTSTEFSGCILLLFAGIIKEQSQETIALETGPGIVVRIAQHEVEAIESQDVSMMPPGLDKQLSQQELSDLMAYLTTLPDGMGHLRVGR